MERSDQQEAQNVDLYGGCLCGNIRYHIDGKPHSSCYCHCSLCRKAHGATPVAWFTIPISCFTVISTLQPKQRFSSLSANRFFCENCGTNMFFKRTGEKEIDIATATLDEASKTLPRCLFPSIHIHTESICKDLATTAMPKSSLSSMSSSIFIDASLAAPMYSCFDGTTQYEGILLKIGKFRYDVWTAEVEQSTILIHILYRIQFFIDYKILSFLI
jgi:hypothetical protein